jgi:hypothetical protein
MKIRTATGIVVCMMLAGTMDICAQERSSCDKPLTLTQKVQRAADILAIQNVASAHEYYHSAILHTEEIRDLWSKRDDVAWKNNTKYYPDRKSFWQFYAVDIHHVDPKGVLWYHMLTTPIIEVAGDGKTAKGIWMSFGNVTDEAMRPEDGNIPQWAEEKYAMDFIKEDGKWKIWHLRTYVEFNSPFQKSWTELNFKAPKGASNEWPPSSPSTSQVSSQESKNTTASNASNVKAAETQPGLKGNYYLGYYPERQKPAFEPAPPAAYCTWKDTTSYTD